MAPVQNGSHRWRIPMLETPSASQVDPDPETRVLLSGVTPRSSNQAGGRWTSTSFTKDISGDVFAPNRDVSRPKHRCCVCDKWD